MKILAIRLKNLASLAGPVELDFTAEPLASAGLFAITGPTGAGKSTLLDALCLALFGSVPRLGDTGRDAKVPDADGEIGTGDPRTLLRRGSGAGFAEVDFVGVDGVRYRARWEANRARDKPEGKLQASRQSLRDLDKDQLLATQKNEYKAVLEARLGLNFEQFTRAVLLAQSEFSAFLKADDNERSELLEKLTDTALYSRLGRRAFEKARAAKEQHRALEAQAQGITALEPAARTALDDRYNAARELLKVRQNQLKQHESLQQWHCETKRLEQDHAGAAEQLDQARQHWVSLTQQRADAASLDHLAPQRHLFARRAELQEELPALVARFDELLQQQADIQARLEQATGQQAAAGNALEQALAQQADSGPALRQAFDQQHHLARLDEDRQPLAHKLEAEESAATAAATELADLDRRQREAEAAQQQITETLGHTADLAALASAWELHRKRLQQALSLAGRLNQGQAELPALQHSADEARLLAEQAAQQLQTIYQEADGTPDDLNERLAILTPLLQDNRQQLRDTDQMERSWQRVTELDARLGQLQVQSQQATEQRERFTAQGMATKQDHSAAEQALKVTLEVVGRQRLARNTSVEQLRAQLEADQPCPVCGSLEHPFHSSEALAATLEGYDEQEEARARQAVEALSTRLAELRTQVTGVIEQQKQLRQQEEPLAQEHRQALADAEQHPLYTTLLEVPVARRSQWLADRQQRLHQQIAQDEQQQRRLLELQQQATRLQQHVQATDKAFQTAARALAEQQRLLDTDRQRLEEELATYAELMPPARLQALREAPAEGFMALDQAVAQRLQLLQRQAEEQQEYSQRQQRIALETSRVQDRQLQLEALRVQVNELDAKRQAVAQQLAETLGNHASADAWQHHLASTVEQARSLQSEANAQTQALHTDKVRLDGEQQAALSRKQAADSALQQLEARLSEWRAGHPGLDDATLARLLQHDDAQAQALRAELATCDKAVEQAGVLAQERQKRLDEHLSQANGALSSEEVEAALAEVREQCEGLERDCGELRAQQMEDDRRREASQQLQEQVAQAFAEFERWGRLSDLIGSREGEKFRKLAQTYNLELLVRHANAQLRQLVRRYRLKRGGSLLGLLVVDTEMGDEVRSVHSLSGGETFLVSLALALGLASMASSTLKIESLFIDEGFGSLDPESLQLAMDALDSLQAQGRKVAVISHVQEMHERIPVQIQVRRQGNGLSEIDVVG